MDVEHYSGESGCVGVFGNGAIVQVSQFSLTFPVRVSLILPQHNITQSHWCYALQYLHLKGVNRRQRISEITFPLRTTN